MNEKGPHCGRFDSHFAPKYFSIIFFAGFLFNWRGFHSNQSLANVPYDICLMNSDVM